MVVPEEAAVATEVAMMVLKEEEVSSEVEAAELENLGLLKISTGTSVEEAMRRLKSACTKNPPEEVEAKVPSRKTELLLLADFPKSM